MNTPYLNKGFELHNRYTIDAELGQGGFGITYLADDNKLNQKVCIKELFISGNLFM
jgi:serine/threonine protein kinase